MKQGRYRLHGSRQYIDTPGGRMKLLILRSGSEQGRKLPGILWIHGGGYMLGMAGMVYMSRGKDLARLYGGVVVSPAYRLAGIKLTHNIQINRIVPIVFHPFLIIITSLAVPADHNNLWFLPFPSLKK